MPLFYFKQFSLSDDDCAMKIGTDAVLLGTWTQTGREKKILDVGTGCGILALMLAQKSEALIDAVEINSEAAKRAEANFISSPWYNRLNIYNVPFDEYIKQSMARYDMVICNPPFFSKSLLSPSAARNLARHHVLLSPENLLEGVAVVLKGGGVFNLILPYSHEESFLQISKKFHFSLNRITRVIPVSGKASNRILISLVKSKIINKCIENELIIRTTSTNYSSEYLQLTQDFLLYS